jgi:hypothetical protein
MASWLLKGSLVSRRGSRLSGTAVSADGNQPGKLNIPRRKSHLCPTRRAQLGASTGERPRVLRCQRALRPAGARLGRRGRTGAGVQQHLRDRALAREPAHALRVRRQGAPRQPSAAGEARSGKGALGCAPCATATGGMHAASRHDGCGAWAAGRSRAGELNTVASARGRAWKPWTMRSTPTTTWWSPPTPRSTRRWSASTCSARTARRAPWPVRAAAAEPNRRTCSAAAPCQGHGW